jgi:hypothetical protein
MIITQERLESTLDMLLELEPVSFGMALSTKCRVGAIKALYGADAPVCAREAIDKAYAVAGERVNRLIEGGKI